MTNDNTSNSEWEYAKQGIDMWLNNDPEKADSHFQANINNIQVFTGHTFITVMNGVISYETDKIDLAQNMLKELEKRCCPDNGWIRTFRNRFFGPDTDTRPMSVILEEKVILADSLLCTAILTFLTQDIGGLMKGSWLLRKAWKLYQQSYDQIYQLYKITFKNKRGGSSINYNMEPVSPYGIEFYKQNYCSTMVRSQTSFDVPNTTKKNENVYTQYEKSLNYTNLENRNLSNSPIISRQSMTKLISYKLGLEKFSSNIFPNEKSPLKSTPNTTIRSNMESNAFQPIPSKNNLFLDIKSMSANKNGFVQVPLSCPESESQQNAEPINNFNFSNYNDLDPCVIKRLMGAVSFGYGIFQLSVSLLPPNLVRFITLLGFEGNKDIGISCLTYSKSSDDMRAPLATLALLWYYTIGAQLFHLESANTEHHIQISKQILIETKKYYEKSAIFLFFRGRLKRLECKTNVAIEFYDAAYRMSAQKELKLLCLHEVGWCRLVQLDFGNAMLHFHELRLASSFSKSFYTYLTTICQGAFGRFDNLIKLKLDIFEILNKAKQKETQIDKFINRRIGKFPSSKNDEHMFCENYWKFFIYEMLFLWNTLYVCSPEVINIIIKDCSQEESNLFEPSVGLAKLILGSCKAQLRCFSEAIESFRQCIEKRKGINEDAHLSAFAFYELAMLLKDQNEVDRQEAKSILELVQQSFKNYDFESRLSPRIHAALKRIQ